MRRHRAMILRLLLIALSTIGAAHADDSSLQLRFEEHRFTPESLAVPAGQPLLVKVVNSSNETIEFESFKLNREKAIEPGEMITLHLPALSPGSYDFYDDFRQDVSRGSITAK
jgi:cupredoxin-like protein